MFFILVRVNVSGTIKCFDEKDCQKISLKLVGVHDTAKTIEAQKGSFEFTSILPGKYKIIINKPDFCWKDSELIVEIRAQSYSNIQFVQAGYAMQYQAEKDIDVMIEGKTEKIHCKEGKNHYCLSNKGEYKITPVGCYKLAETTFLYNTNSPAIIKLIPTQYLIEGKMVVNDSSLTNIQNYVGISVKITDEKGSVSEDTLSIKSNHHGEYPFQYYAKGKVAIQMTPYVKPLADGTEPNILFYPKSHSIVMANKCILGEETIVFGVNKGLIIQGRISPPVGNIIITARDAHDNSVVASTISSNSGEYKLGPLYDEKKYVVSAQRDGYRVIKDPANPYNFIAEQLSFLSIQVRTGESQALSGVIFDLSHSGRTYRNNTRTNEEVNE